MTDTFLTIHQISADPAMRARVAACAAQQGASDPEAWTFTNRYRWAASPGWAEAVDYWRAANPEGGDGWASDPAVITDGAILSAVQPMLNPQADDDPVNP